MSPAHPTRPTRQPAPPPGEPAYPVLSDPLDRRRFLSACARAAIAAGTAIALGGRIVRAQQPPPPDDYPPPDGIIAPPDWPQPHVRLVRETPIDVTFRDGTRARLVVAIVLGDGPEPEVDADALVAVVEDVAAGFDRTVLGSGDARHAFEDALRARLDDVLKAFGGSVDAVAIAEVPAQTEEGSAPPPGGSHEERQALSGVSTPAPSAAPPAAVVHQTRRPLPRPPGRCLIHGDGPCPPSERRD